MGARNSRVEVVTVAADAVEAPAAAESATVSGRGLVTVDHGFVLDGTDAKHQCPKCRNVRSFRCSDSLCGDCCRDSACPVHSCLGVPPRGARRACRRRKKKDSRKRRRDHKMRALTYEAREAL